MGHIEAEQVRGPGHSYSMSSSYWVNTGTEPETLVFHADPPAGASWIKMAESSVTLDPGQAVSIPVTLTVPVGAAKGIYGARLEASGAEESVEFGVGVRPGCAGPAAPPLVPGGGRGFPLPLWVVTGLLLAAAPLTWLARQRRTDCDHPVHRLRGGKWQSLAEFRHADPRQMLASALAGIERYVLPDSVREDYLTGYQSNRFAGSMRYLRSYPEDAADYAALITNWWASGHEATSRTPVKSLNSQSSGKGRMS